MQHGGQPEQPLAYWNMTTVLKPHGACDDVTRGHWQPAVIAAALWQKPADQRKARSLGCSSTLSVVLAFCEGFAAATHQTFKRPAATDLLTLPHDEF